VAGTNSSWILEAYDRLLISTDDRVSTYRVRGDGEFEFQSARGLPWQQLAPAQVEQHVALNTVFGQWLLRRAIQTARRASTVAA
jgi:hypothetical protein